jgi:V/A-type H+-transporting ATPase subunit E
MGEELQHLIERIQREAVDTGEKQATQIVAQAKEQAAALVREAEQKAAAHLAKAEQDAKQFTERSLQTLRQASRDLLISVGQGVENILGNLAVEAAGEALTIETVQQMLVKLAESYVGRNDRDRRIEVQLSAEDQARLVTFFKDRYHDRLQRGIEIRGDERVLKGFKVSFDAGHLTHNFTQEAIGEALANFLRPHLADIVYQVAREGGKGGGAPR